MKISHKSFWLLVIALISLSAAPARGETVTVSDSTKILTLQDFLPFYYDSSKYEAPKHKNLQGWYAGAALGSPFGLSTFSSFTSQGQWLLGGEVGGFIGFQSEVGISIEFSLTGGRAYMSAMDCCEGFWLSNTGARYSTAQDDMEGWYYDALRSQVLMHQYAIQVNVNFLQFFKATKHFPLQFAIYPKLDVLTAQGNIQVASDKSALQTYVDKVDTGVKVKEMYIGMGGGAQLSYQISDLVRVGVFAEALSMSDSFDGVKPHSTGDINLAFNGGAKIAFTLGLGKKKKAIKAAEEAAILKAYEEYVEEMSNLPEEPVVVPVRYEWVKKTSEDLSIYFSRGSYVVSRSEMKKIHEIVNHLVENPETRVVIEGWCDHSGTYVYNRGISILRAEAIRDVICDWSSEIDPNRIAVLSMGSDDEASSEAKARRGQVYYFEKERVE